MKNKYELLEKLEKYDKQDDHLFKVKENVEELNKFKIEISLDDLYNFIKSLK